MRFYTFVLIVWASCSFANVEKVIFLGPESISIPTQHPNLDDLGLDRISPVHWSLRTQMNAEFPDDKNTKGKASWFLLEGLETGHRYEIRICWAATQPTQFCLFPHTLKEVFETPSLISSLALYSESRQTSAPTIEEFRPNIHRFVEPSIGLTPLQSSSTLLLEIFSAADYFTTNQTLMNNVPLVDVDIILDPYLLNIFPKSLLPTAVYITILAVLGWYLSDVIWKWLYNLSETPQIRQSATYKITTASTSDDKKQS
ncbi:MAG: hypothetical protein M1830_002101 [Pleopsidium flavum]|nr:MAG: hypothetical protein M1830_002101 [Pleopsidium flavum]